MWRGRCVLTTKGIDGKHIHVGFETTRGGPQITFSVDDTIGNYPACPMSIFRCGVSDDDRTDRSLGEAVRRLMPLCADYAAIATFLDCNLLLFNKITCKPLQTTMEVS